jgi:hypothetical protein
MLQKTATRLERLLEASDKFVGDATDPPLPGSAIARAREADLGEPYDFSFVISGSSHLPTPPDTWTGGAKE